MELLCYNCYFLYVTDLFNTKDLSALEDNLDVTFKTSEHVDLELDEYNLQKLRELGLNIEILPREPKHRYVYCLNDSLKPLLKKRLFNN